MDDKKLKLKLKRNEKQIKRGKKSKREKTNHKS